MDRKEALDGGHFAGTPLIEHSYLIRRREKKSHLTFNNDSLENVEIS